MQTSNETKQKKTYSADFSIAVIFLFIGNINKCPTTSALLVHSRVYYYISKNKLSSAIMADVMDILDLQQPSSELTKEAVLNNRRKAIFDK